MPSQHPSPPDLPSPAVDGDRSTVSLREAAEILGLSEAAVLMRVFRGLIPSLVDDDGSRRVPRQALDAVFELEERPHASDDVALLSSGLEALAAELARAQARIAALESREPDSPPLMGGLEALADELAQARARITALESSHQQRRPQWRRYWEAWLNPGA
jgi:hypothetical protein